jgi:hypothetical protein
VLACNRAEAARPVDWRARSWMSAVQTLKVGGAALCRPITRAAAAARHALATDKVGHAKKCERRVGAKEVLESLVHPQPSTGIHLHFLAVHIDVPEPSPRTILALEWVPKRAEKAGAA